MNQKSADFVTTGVLKLVSNALGTERLKILGLFRALGLSDEVPESRVRVPSDMIAIGDGDWYVCIPGFGWPGWAHPVHGRGGNAVFCDAHVEFGNGAAIPRNPKRQFEYIPTEAHAKRWNNDNEPHSETWPRN